MTSHQADELKAFYRHYIDRCNAHRFEDLSEFVAQDVEVNGHPQGLGGYIAGLSAVIAAFPHYRWNLRHLVVEGDWLAAHFINTGTHTGTSHGVTPPRGGVITQEFAMYRIASGKIAEFWGTAEKRR